MNLYFVCCLCREDMPQKEANAIIVVKGWGKPTECSQQWFCHIACFEKATGETFDAEPDDSTVDGDAKL